MASQPCTAAARQLSTMINSLRKLLMYSLNLHVEHNIADQCVEKKMKYITHSSVSSLTPAAQAIRDVFNIKLTRAKERHAEAMGFNSYNHLSETVKKSSVNLPYDDYIENLANSLKKHHDIHDVHEKSNQLSELLFPSEITLGSDAFDTVDIHIYRTKVMSNEERIVRNKTYSDNNFSDLFIFDLACDEDIEDFSVFSDIKIGTPILFIPSQFISHMKSFNGVMFLITTNLLEENTYLTNNISFEYVKKESIDIPNQERIIDYDFFSDPMYDSIQSLRRILEEEEKKIISSIAIEGGVITPCLLPSDSSIYSVLIAIENHVSFHYELDFDYEENESFYGITLIDFHNKKANVLFMPLDSLYEFNFSGEFIEAYADLYVELTKLLHDLKIKFTVSMEGDVLDFHGSPHKNVYFNNFRDFKNEDSSLLLMKKNSPHVNMQVLIKLFEANDVSIINAHSAVRHSCGNDVVFGCTAFDKEGDLCMRFQIFAPSAYEFYQKFLPKLTSKTSLSDFIVSKNLEYNLTSILVDLPTSDCTYTFSFPEINAQPQQIAFIAFVLDNSSELGIIEHKNINVEENPDLIPNFHHILRQSTIFTPIFMPDDISIWHESTKEIVEKLQNEKRFNERSLQIEMTALFDKYNSNREYSIVASPIIFHLSENHYLQPFYNYCLTNTANAEFKNIESMRKHIGLPITDYFLIDQRPHLDNY